MARALYQKLGIQQSTLISVIHPPEEFDQLFQDVPFPLDWKKPHVGVDLIHFFPQNLSELEDRLPVLQDTIQKDGMIWVSWFKKASKVPTDISEDEIRNTALSLKLVDVKVCAVNDRYSALKLVIRKHLR